MNSEEVRSFYNDFLESDMLDYRVRGNPRIEKATDRILEFVRPDSSVLDVGCGIGITVERIADKVESGHVWAFDISDHNIWYARETIDQSNVTFFTADVTENKNRVQDQLTTEIDVVVLVDVIEHIPKEDHAELFNFFQSITSDQSFIVLTYPSPQYQRQLEESNPDELQIIDQAIELDELLNAAQPAGFSLKHYSLETIWKRNQYVHCVLQMDDALSNPSSKPKGLSDRIMTRISALWRHHVLYPYRHWKYVKQIFSDQSYNGGE